MVQWVAQEPVRYDLRDEAKEVRPDERRKARKNRKHIHCNMLRIFSGRERRRWSWIVRRSRTVNVGQAPNLWYSFAGSSPLSELL